MNEVGSTNTVQCPGCQAGFPFRPELAGRKVKCPQCQTTFQVSAGQPRQAAAPAKLCGYCREQVPLPDYEFHFNQHMVSLGLTGHMPGYDEDKQYKGDISDQPRFFVHSKCGKINGMAEKIVRTFLANPWNYGYARFCVGCRRGVPNTECTWVETGTNMQDHIRQLQAQHPNAAALRRSTVMTISLAALFCAFFLALVLAGIAAFFASWSTVGMLFGIVLLVGTPLLIGLFFKMRGGLNA